MKNSLDKIKWNSDGLVTAIAQDSASGDILMLAWMNRDALAETLVSGKAVYWSRSRHKLWRKGEESGHEQIVQEVRLDCDSDAILLKVEQKGGIACHTGRHSCFYQVYNKGEWQSVDSVLKDPTEIYTK